MSFIPNFLDLFLPLKYITIRFGLSLITSFAFMILIMPCGIQWLKNWKKNIQPIRDDGVQTHLLKHGTPTMGGIFIITSICISSLLWCNLHEPKVLFLLFITVTFAFIGFMDDYVKITQKSPKGIRGKYKLYAQAVLVITAIFFLKTVIPDQINMKLYIPGFKNIIINLGYFYFIFAFLVISGTSNAVNLTDGLDGLVSVPIALSAFALGIIAYLSGNTIYSSYLHISNIPGSGEIAVFCGALIGSSLGFLWFNAKPADIFMGDVGSLGLGGAIGSIAILIKQEILLLIIGFVFLMEALSVILQVGSYKMRNGKRIFLMAPIHHHFEKKGLSETKVVVRFWIISILSTIIGLAIIKIS